MFNYNLNKIGNIRKIGLKIYQFQYIYIYIYIFKIKDLIKHINI